VSIQFRELVYEDLVSTLRKQSTYITRNGGFKFFRKQYRFVVTYEV